MIASVLQIIGAVRAALADHVLADLAPKTWTAGSVRSSLALLAYAEDALANGLDVLPAGIAAMTGFIEQLLSMQGVSFLDTNVRRDLASALAAARAQPGGDLGTLDDTHRGLKAALSELIARSIERGRSRDDGPAIVALRDCLRSVSAGEQVLAGRAGAMPPF